MELERGDAEEFDTMIDILRRRVFIVVLAGITVMGIALRIHFLNQPMRYDESYNFLHYANHSCAFILSNYVPNNHILHTLMVHFVSSWIGDSPACLRLPALVAGILLIPVAAWMAWLLSRNAFAAIFAATAVSVSSALIEYSTNARGYSWLALLAAIQFIITVRAIVSHRQRATWIVWAIVGALGSFAVPVMFLWSIALCGAAIVTSHFRVAHESSRRSVSRNALLGLMLCAIITGVLYAPAIITSGLSGLRSTHRMSTVILDRQLPGFGDALFAAGKLFARDAGLVWTAIIGIGIVAAFVRAVVRRERPVLVAMIAAAACAASITMFRVPLPGRVWLFIWPIAIALSSIGVTTLIDFARARIAGIDLGTDSQGRILAICMMGAFMAMSAGPLLKVCQEPYLVSEPGGLVDVEPAIDACREFGAAHCTVISRYTPATTYYLQQKQLPGMPNVNDPNVQRIYVVAANAEGMRSIWNDRVPGYENFTEPVLDPIKSSQPIYVADRREASCEKYPATRPEATH